MQRNRGFTLIELMIVVGIIGAIMVFAIPAYLEQMQKTRRTDAKTALVTLAQLQETFYVENGNRYAATLIGDGAINCHTKGVCRQDNAKATSIEGYYILTAGPGSTNDIVTSFQITATIASNGAQAEDTICASFSIDSRNRKTSYDSSGDPSSDCW